MSTLTNFRMTDQEMNDIIAINKNMPPVMKMGDYWSGLDLQERINDYWKILGEKYGFDHMSVQMHPDDPDKCAFIARTIEKSPMAVETLPAITFEGVILDEKEPVKFTPELIRTKSAPLLLLTIKDIFDEKGLKEVKAAKQKIVKTRTAIEKIEKSEKDKLKIKQDKEKAELTDYAATLYAACREGENSLQTIIDTHETEKAAAAKKLADDKKEKTEGRNAKMYAIGMQFNGQGFSGYGKFINQDVLHAMADDKYLALVTEIEGLSMDQDVTGKVAEAPAMTAPPVQRTTAPSWGGGFSVPKSEPAQAPAPPAEDRVYDTAVYERAMPQLGARLVITKGMIEPEADAIISNDRILESLYFVQVVR